MLPAWVSSWCYQQMLDKTGKCLTGTNTPAYLASLSAVKETCFVTLTPGLNLINPFYLLLTKGPNKLEKLHLAIPFQPCLTFVGNR